MTDEQRAAAPLASYCPEIRAFSNLWQSINAKPTPVKGDDGRISHYVSYPWENVRETRTHRGKPWHVIGNPHVWVIGFRIESEVATW